MITNIINSIMSQQTGKMCMFSSYILPKNADDTEIYFLHLTITEPRVTCYKTNCCLDN